MYVAVSNDKHQIKKSASGGIFAALATYLLSLGGVVYGASLKHENGKFVVFHREVTSIKALHELQGSKYVQSDIGNCFKEIRNHLSSNRIVLFSGTPCGTPCQCAGLKAFLRKDYSNLFLVDIICHGVPNQQFFNDYIDFEFSKLRGIKHFLFRDKSKGWELRGRIDYDKNKSKTIVAGSSSYYSLFLDAQIYRENCYSCKYANDHRPGDLTIGDYWGIQNEHPELIGEKFNIKDGISCIISNTDKGEHLLAEVKEYITLEKSTYEKVARRNAQLCHPSVLGRYRSKIFKLYKDKGYKAVNIFFLKTYTLQILIHYVFNLLPYGIKDFLRRVKHH